MLSMWFGQIIQIPFRSSPNSLAVLKDLWKSIFNCYKVARKQISYFVWHRRNFREFLSIFIFQILLTRCSKDFFHPNFKFPAKQKTCDESKRCKCICLRYFHIYFQTNIFVNLIISEQEMKKLFNSVLLCDGNLGKTWGGKSKHFVYKFLTEKELSAWTVIIWPNCSSSNYIHFDPTYQKVGQKQWFDKSHIPLLKDFLTLVFDDRTKSTDKKYLYVQIANFFGFEQVQTTLINFGCSMVLNGSNWAS